MSTTFLNNLLVSEIPEIVLSANRAAEILTRYEKQEISKSEFDELIDELTNLNNISVAMINVETQREIVSAFNLILTLKAVTGII
jgi:hypothetical protein